MKELTAKQWQHLSAAFCPTASKVVTRGAQNPYPIPPKRLPTTATTGQRTTGTTNDTKTTILRTRPSLFVLELQVGKTEIRTQHHILYTPNLKVTTIASITVQVAQFKYKGSKPCHTEVSPQRMCRPKPNYHC